MLRKRLLFVFILFIISLFLIFSVLLWHANRTNPYSKNSEMTPAYVAVLDKNNQFILKKNHSIYLTENPLAILIVKLQAAMRIVGNGWFPIKPFTGNEVQIINAIHQERFDPIRAYIISGDHFADFYPRNYGMFYQAALDSRIQSSYQDWENRQKIILQTTAMYLDILSQSNRAYPAYMPLSHTRVVGIDIWSYPSDSLYAVLFQLSALTNDKFISSLFPAHNFSSSFYPLQTQQAGEQLLQKYKSALKRQVISYENYVLDSHTHLVKKDIYLSGVRDGMKRQSSFYDNVIAWATAKQASELGILSVSNREMDTWKQKIISAFWDNKNGIFIDDLSIESKKNHIFPGDAFVIAQTQFLNPNNPQEREKILALIAYVKKHKLDQPFPLPWGPYDQPEKYYFFDRYAAQSYMGHTIFSHWSMEYIKELLLVSNAYPEGINDAVRYLSTYSKSIEKYGGYPEIYYTNGNMYRTFFYTAILHTGWIIDYEQAKMMTTSRVLTGRL